MLAMLRDLVEHKGYANAVLLQAVRAHAVAASDRELWDLFHHILLANRFWLLSVLGAPFDHAGEAAASPSFDALVERFAGVQTEERAWFAAATERDVERVLEGPLIPGGRCSVAQAYLQVCLHSHGHRAQAAKMLRRLGGEPPATDFILWLTNRPA
jgi:uncharacterized damage-inducible protein DinB